MDDLPVQCCARCFFSERALGAQGAERALGAQGPELTCHRFPPTGQMVTMQVPPSVKNPNGGMAQAIGSVWPPVQGAQWCGEYKTSSNALRT